MLHNCLQKLTVMDHSRFDEHCTSTKESPGWQRCYSGSVDLHGAAQVDIRYQHLESSVAQRCFSDLPSLYYGLLVSEVDQRPSSFGRSTQKGVCTKT